MITIVNNIKYNINNANDSIQSTLLKNIQWNDEIVKIIIFFIKKFKLKHFVNIGSHIGSVCLPISKNIENVTAIEAYLPTYIDLNNNILLNNISNITTLNIAIGNKREQIYFSNIDNERLINNSGGMHVFSQDDKNNNSRSISQLFDYSNTFVGEMYKLDDIDVDNFDIIVIDIEGMEEQMIYGAKNKILKNKPIIIIEIWNNSKRKFENMNTTCEYIINFICNLDYYLFKKIEDDFIFLPNKLSVHI